MSDPAKYRTRDEVNKVKTDRDPINKLKSELMAKNVVNEVTLKTIDAEVKKLISDAADFALNAKLPDSDELMTDIYI